jgi:hypothetical protein
MTNISAQAKAAQDAARQQDGRFGTQAKEAPTGRLGLPKGGGERGWVWYESGNRILARIIYRDGRKLVWNEANTRYEDPEDADIWREADETCQ